MQAASSVTLCTHEGSTIYHDCTVNDILGIGTTIWKGDTFKCMDRNNQIILNHSGYSSGQRGVCGNFSAESLSVKGSEYTSRLIINGSVTQMIRINCTLAGEVLVEAITVRVGG